MPFDYCQTKVCREVGRGVLGADELTYSYEESTCGTPLFTRSDRESGRCPSCRRCCADPDGVYEPAHVGGVWTMTLLSETDIAERMARPPIVRRTCRS